MTDRFQIGSVEVHRGDCRAVVPTLAGEFDAVILDPPFAIDNGMTETQQTTANGGRRRLRFPWDDAETKHVVGQGVDAALGRLSARGSAIVFCGLDTVEPVRAAFVRHGLTPKPFAWAKPYPPPAAPGNWWPSAFEVGIYGMRRGAFFGDADPCRRNWVLCDAYRHGQPGKVAHPTQKPLRLIKYLVETMVPPGGRLLDCFAGSGTAGVAAIETGRSAVLVEIDPAFVRLIRRRLDHAEGVGSLFDPSALAPSA